MCQIRSYIKDFCEHASGHCVCHHQTARPSLCLNPACGKTFQSRCPAQLFCSLECQEQTEFGRSILQLVDREQIHNDKVKRHQEQVRQACRKYKKTEKGKIHRRLQCKRRRKKLKGIKSVAVLEVGL
ncbi:MAG: hypothetical protein LBQ50_01225 [Planctomycetaceae bacterium]|jgi:hypothetical protein|nr:hypothetical protein [Planctomycetaceae bacterium]